MGFKHVQNRARKATNRPATAPASKGRQKGPIPTVPPSKADPTRTGAIRRAFIAALRKGYAKLKRMVRELVLRELGGSNKDTYGVATATTTVMTPATVGNTANDPTGNAWTYETNPNKVKRFREWIRAQTGSVLAGDSLIQEFIDKAYRKGTSRAYSDLRRTRSSSSTSTSSNTSKSTLAGRRGDIAMEGVYGGESQEGLGHTTRRHVVGRRSNLGGGSTIPQEILPGMVPGQPEEHNFVRIRMSKAPTVEKVKLLASRTFSELDGINQRMGAAMSRTLAEGLASGWSVHRMATQMAAQAGLAFKRAVTIVRTEIIRTHAEAQLDALEDLGERKVSAAVEWETAGDSAVCPKCESNEGVVFSIEDARGMIPVHANCRCAWQPLKEVKTRKRKEGK